MNQSRAKDVSGSIAKGGLKTRAQGLTRLTALESQRAFDFEPLKSEEFDYQGLGPEDREFVKERELLIRDSAQQSAQRIWSIGQWLTEVKARLEHGQWLPWLEANFGWTETTALRLMRVHDFLGSNTVLELTIDCRTLCLIEKPSAKKE